MERERVGKGERDEERGRDGQTEDPRDREEERGSGEEDKWREMG